MKKQLLITTVTLLIHITSTHCMELLEAIRTEDVAAVEKALKTEKGPNYCKNGHLSPLTMAIMCNNQEITELLIKHKADVNARDKLGYLSSTPLEAAAANNNITIMQILLNCKADPNNHKDAFWCPLAYAADKGNVSSTQLLIDHGADLQVLTKNWHLVTLNEKQRQKMQATITQLTLPTTQTMTEQPTPKTPTQAKTDKSSELEKSSTCGDLFQSCFDALTESNKKNAAQKES